ncbi:hypothetical protein A8C56_21705 [Niabella ginsenosidivorans]|uniref:T9SS C-terminal target domain-containing protein n=1 Tax=Niabella ginsenosidivorans TaxID=1176587 RepID=A0A1A9I7D1_9BACT|nr:hypothetical protein [Niabella ginsenosidivorans]ANH83245.1 hypothetical protein A8C56_21705 [Niabella ginsenosidivorans]
MKHLKTMTTIMLAAIVFASCSNKDSELPPPVTPPGENGTVDIRGSISANQTWTKDKKYRLRGYVYVENGTTLTIEPGTQIISNADSAGVLVIYKGAKINAVGTATDPIVFTSAEANPAPGQLGGVILVGNATGNGNHSVLEGGVDAAHQKFGGTNDADNSGTMQYVRIEYAGKAVNPNDEINGLSLYAVGSGTTIDHIQVVNGLDDAFEFFGGAVNCKYLIAYNCADDDYDMDDGYHGKIQFAVSVKAPGWTDNKTGGDLSNNFEVDNTNGTLPYTTTPVTHPILSNFTAIGPNNAAGTSADYGYGMRFRRGSKPVLANSVILGGQKAGLVAENTETQAAFQAGDAMFYNSLLSAVTTPFLTLPTGSALTNQQLQDLITGTTYGTKLLASAADAGLTDAINPANPNLQPKSGSLALTTAGKFDKSTLSDAFFVKTNYIGAFDGTNDWTKGWTVWGSKYVLVKQQ